MKTKENSNDSPKELIFYWKKDIIQAGNNLEIHTARGKSIASFYWDANNTYATANVVQIPDKKMRNNQGSSLFHY